MKPLDVVEAPSWLLLNAVADDELSLRDVLAGLQQQGHHLGFAGEAGSLPQRVVELKASGARVGVLTVWSRQAVLDERVVAVADAALEADCLIPIRIEELDPPIGFRQAQTYDIVHLSEESGVNLGRELKFDTATDSQSAQLTATAPTQLLLRAVEWALFVGLPILVYSMLFEHLIQGISVYITLVAAAFLVADTALIGVPSYLVPIDPARSIQKLTHCSRIDLVLQTTLAVVLAAFTGPRFLGLGAVSLIIPFLSLMSSAAVALLLRYGLVGLWLAYRASPKRWAAVAVSWLVFMAVPAALYGDAILLLIPGLTKVALFFYLATSSTLTIVFGVPGFAPPQSDAVATQRVSAGRLTLTDLVIQTLLSVLGAGVMHRFGGYPLAQSVLRLLVCAALATIGRYIALRLLWARAARSQP